MLENRLEGPMPAPSPAAHTDPDLAPTTIASGQSLPPGFLLCTLGMVLATLLMMTPLMRVPDPVITLHFAPGQALAWLSSWLPTWPGTTPQNAYGEFFVLLFLASCCYGIAALLIQRESVAARYFSIRRAIWLGTVLAGALYVLTPAMLSHDILVYASYSRVWAVYHANPYFTPISAFPHDPFTPINYWASSVSAYGPIWTFICGFWGWALPTQPVAYVLAFRICALACHLLNVWLVGRTLQTLGRSPRTVTLGMLLYAWNPLVLLESGLGGHNDGLMLTFMLLGVLLAARAEHDGTALRLRSYLPVTLALTLAALVKFTALPVLVAYLIWLLCKALRPSSMSSLNPLLALPNCLPALRTLLGAALPALLLALASYAPFWLGHSWQAINSSFKTTPSALGAENSFLRSLIEWLKYHPTLHSIPLFSMLVKRHIWDNITYGTIVLCLLPGTLWLWLRPTLKSFLLVALTTLTAVLLVSPWFYSWYVIWLLGLAAVCLPMWSNRFQAALLALTIALSFSALSTYLFNGGLFETRFYLVSLFVTIPPLCAFLLVLIGWRKVTVCPEEMPNND